MPRKVLSALKCSYYRTRGDHEVFADYLTADGQNRFAFPCCPLAYTCCPLAYSRKIIKTADTARLRETDKIILLL